MSIEYPITLEQLHEALSNYSDALIIEAENRTMASEVLERMNKDAQAVYEKSTFDHIQKALKR